METAASECKSLFLLFLEVLRFSEGLSQAADPKILFKGAQIVEDMCLKTASLQAEKEFEDKLQEFWALQGLEKFPLKYFKNASHLVLSRYLFDNKFSNSEVKVAIREFVSYKSEEEFFEVVKNLSETHQVIRSVVQQIDKKGKILEYKAAVLMEDLKRLLINTNGSADQVFTAVSNTYGNNKESFMLLLKVLCLHSDCELSLHIQKIVLLFVCESMKDCKKTYIYSCILDLGDEEFNEIVVRWDSFTTSLAKLMEIAAKGLKCEYSGNSFSWKYPGEEKGLSFDLLVAFINKIKVVQENGDFLKDMLNKWKDESCTLITEDLLRICKIK